MPTTTRAPHSIGIAGLGAVGRTIAAALAAGIPGLAFNAVTARDRGKAAAWLAAHQSAVPVVPLAELPARSDVVERARSTSARILVPTGALIGLDAVRAAAEGRIRSVRMVTRKPPYGLAGAPYLVANNISLDGLTAPLKI